MTEFTVKIDYLGKTYQTNVIAPKETEEKEIQQMALEQIKKQVAVC